MGIRIFPKKDKKRVFLPARSMRLAEVVDAFKDMIRLRNKAGKSFLRIMDKDGVVRGKIIDVGFIIDWTEDGEQVHRPFVQVDSRCDV